MDSKRAIEIEILTSPGCVECRAAKSVVHSATAAAVSEGIGVQVREVDVTKEPDAVIRYGVLRVPVVAIDGRPEFTGVPKEHELLAKLRKRNAYQ